MEEKLTSDKLEESETIEKEKVKLNREWSFWENYESKNKDEKDYSKLLKEIYTFNDIISFWQFWNKYPGSETSSVFFNGDCLKYFFNEKYRIIAMNLFEKGIRPEWEDEKNKKGKIFNLEYIVNNELEKFLTVVKENWTKLLCLIIGESLPCSKYINGVRFVDKTKLSGWKKIIFRFEVWVNSGISDEEVEILKKELSTTFGCSGIMVKSI